MKIARLDYIINTVSRTNILPVESSCNTSCIFCSHRQNPAGIEIYRLPELTVEDYKEIAYYEALNIFGATIVVNPKIITTPTPTAQG